MTVLNPIISTTPSSSAFLSLHNPAPGWTIPFFWTCLSSCSEPPAPAPSPPLNSPDRKEPKGKSEKKVSSILYTDGKPEKRCVHLMAPVLTAVLSKLPKGLRNKELMDPEPGSGRLVPMGLCIIQGYAVNYEISLGNSLSFL